MSPSSRFAVAVHVLALMARSSDESLKSEQMAGSVNTNPVVVRRMLCDLADGNLVVSHTGSAGGSRLARQPDQITLLDVYRAVDCQGVFSLHQHPNRRCPVGVSIGRVLAEIQAEIDSSIEQVLAQITIGDVVLRLTPSVRKPEIKKK